MSPESTPLILIAGTNAHNLELLGAFLFDHGFRCQCALGLEALDAAIVSGAEPDLALLDLTGFDAAIWERCQRLHDRSVRLLIVSARQSASLQQQSIAHGAQGVLVKPLVLRELIGLVRTLLAN